MNKTRRNFMILGAVAGVGAVPIFKSLRYFLQKEMLEDNGLRNLVADSTGRCFINPLLQAKAFSVKGDIMTDGLAVPEKHDGMACFALASGGYVLARNHEIALKAGEVSPAPEQAYDSQCGGGVSLVQLDEQLNLVDHRLALTGTATNCSGGITPWGTWLSCEEVFLTPGVNAGISERHGYVYEVDPRGTKLIKGIPLKAMGRFQHEAVAAGPATGFLYMTEDRENGCFYRFLPRTAGKLQEGGVLQALSVGENGKCTWLAVENADPSDDSVRATMQKQGATAFARGEGIAADHSHIYFTASIGGKNKLGQIFKLSDSFENSAEIELVYEANNKMVLQNPDQLTVNGWGDLIVCEDPVDGEFSRLRGITPQGHIYTIAASTHGEWTGACFSPDKNTLFVNQQDYGVTYAIRGNWEEIRRGGLKPKTVAAKELEA